MRSYLLALGALFLAVSLWAVQLTPYTFSDATAQAGIHFVHYKGFERIATILEEAGPGVCVADFDSDGLMDIYFVNGRDLHGRTVHPSNALYRNKGDGTFEDVTSRAGVPGNAYGLGCTWGDYDNDGHPDLYITQYGKNILYHNDGNGRFTDVTAKAHVDGTDFGAQVHTGAAFFDYDRDGLLDLYAGSYVDFGPDAKQTCQVYGAESSCPPQQYKGSHPVLYHNNGDGTFTNLTKAAGVYQENGKNLSVLAGDYDGDGWPDLFVANDGEELYLYRNQHDGTFHEEGLAAGVAVNENGGTMAAMCLSLGDYDNDGAMDLYVSDFQDQGDHLWRGNGHGGFEDLSQQVGLTAATIHSLGFGGGFLDYDNDGQLDLFIANGHVYQGIEHSIHSGHYKQPNLLFHNEGHGKLLNVSGTAGEPFQVPRLGRGVAFVDYNNDGAMDIVVGNSDDSPTLLKNRGGGGHFLVLELHGVKSNRDAIGTRVQLRRGSLQQMREIVGGGSYLSQSDPRVHFGLGDSTLADSLTVQWPSGLTQEFRNVKADRFYELTEAAGLRQRGR